MRAAVLLALGAPWRGGAVDNGMGRVPPLGWNSWCTDVACTKDYCDEGIVRKQIDAIVSEGLRDIGWRYITLDDCWGGPRLPNGSYYWDPVRFPSGIPHLAEYAHARGLLLGLYLSSGNETCNAGGRAFRVPGSLGRYDDDAASVAAWGVDYIKLDWCGYGPDGKRTPSQCGPGVDEAACKEQRFRSFSAALNATGRPIYLAASSAIGTPEWAPRYLNSWRIGGDHHDWWDTSGTSSGTWMVNSSTRYKIENLNRANGCHGDGCPEPGGGAPGGAGRRWATGGCTRGDGCGWNDADFVFTGGQGCGTRTGDSGNGTLRSHCPMQTAAEYRAAFSMWAIGASPLLVAVDVANMTAAERGVLTNAHVAAMHLDPAARPGRRAAVDASCVSAVPQEVMKGFPPCQVWKKAMRDGSVVLALYNSEPDREFLCAAGQRECADGTTSNCCNVPVPEARAHRITANFSELGIGPEWGTPEVFDLWEGRRLGRFAGAYSREVAPSSVALVSVTRGSQ